MHSVVLPDQNADLHRMQPVVARLLHLDVAPESELGAPAVRCLQAPVHTGAVAKRRSKIIGQQLVQLDPATRDTISTGSPLRHPARSLALWREHGAKLLAHWIAEWPGTRPQSWWLFDAPERRR